jgi:hypothetical protein
MNDQPKIQEPALDYNNLQFHPLANIFPLIEGEEFDAFVDIVAADHVASGHDP